MTRVTAPGAVHSRGCGHVQRGAASIFWTVPGYLRAHHGLRKELRISIGHCRAPPAAQAHGRCALGNEAARGRVRTDEWGRRERDGAGLLKMPSARELRTSRRDKPRERPSHRYHPVLAPFRLS